MGLKRISQKTSWYLAKKPLIKNTECGDLGIVKKFDDMVFIAIVDVLGHSKEAYKLGLIAKEFLEKNYRKDLVETMKGLHERLRGTRGAVAGLCLLELNTGIFRYVGIGNITLRKFGSNNVRIIPRDGIVGYTMPLPKEETMILHKGDVLLLHTDGVKEHFNLEDYPEILKNNVKMIAKRIMHQFGKKNDDATCIALRYM